MAVGEKGKRVRAVDLGGKDIGDMGLGHNLDVKCVDVSKKHLVLAACDSFELHFYNGPVYKYNKSMQAAHKGFIN